MPRSPRRRCATSRTTRRTSLPGSWRSSGRASLLRSPTCRPTGGRAGRGPGELEVHLAGRHVPWPDRRARPEREERRLDHGQLERAVAELGVGVEDRELAATSAPSARSVTTSSPPCGPVPKILPSVQEPRSTVATVFVPGVSTVATSGLGVHAGLGSSRKRGWLRRAPRSPAPRSPGRSRRPVPRRAAEPLRGGWSVAIERSGGEARHGRGAGCGRSGGAGDEDVDRAILERRWSTPAPRQAASAALMASAGTATGARTRAGRWGSARHPAAWW